MKRVITLIRQSPLKSLVPSEALRMSLGLMLTDNKVSVVLIEDGVYLSVCSRSEGNEYPQIKRHVETLKELGCEVIADQVSLEERGLLDRNLDASVTARSEINRILEESDRVIGF